jgi:hypothetical protein
LETEILVLRHQLNVLRRKSRKRLAFGSIDRLVFAGLYRVAPGVLDALKILKPQTVIRWHRADYDQHKDRGPTHGYEASREAAMAAFAKSWRRE